jgi:hypothetical protein
MREKQNETGDEKSSLFEYLNEINQSKAYPRNLGMMKYNKGNEDVDGDINARSFYMGSRYAGAFSKGLKNNKIVKHINIGRNNLRDKGVIDIVNSIQDHVESIDMSNNIKLTSPSYQRLGLLLDDPYKR